MDIEAKLRDIYQAYSLRYGNSGRLRMSHANCIKIVIELAAQANQAYRVMLNQINDRVWYDWRRQISRDAIRESFLAWGGRWVTKPEPGDLLFMCLNYAPVDHLGLCLNAYEFVHLDRRGLRLDRIVDYKPELVSVGRL